jgi:hypothetical protein
MAPPPPPPPPWHPRLERFSSGGGEDDDVGRRAVAEMEGRVDCVYDSQGAFACPGRGAYASSLDAERRRILKRDNAAWIDRRTPVENASDMRYAFPG